MWELLSATLPPQVTRLGNWQSPPPPSLKATPLGIPGTTALVGHRRLAWRRRRCRRPPRSGGRRHFRRTVRRKVGRGLAKYRRGVAEAVLCKYRGLLFAKSPDKITPKAQVALATTKTSQLRSSRTSHRSTRNCNEVAGRLRIQIRNYVIFWYTWQFSTALLSIAVPDAHPSRSSRSTAWPPLRTRSANMPLPPFAGRRQPASRRYFADALRRSIEVEALACSS